MRDLSTLTPEHFEVLDGASFIVDAGSGEMPLQLEGVQRQTAATPHGRVPFSVFWLGAREARMLPQGIRALRHPDLGELELFLVPVGELEGRTRYQAALA